MPSEPANLMNRAGSLLPEPVSRSTAEQRRGSLVDGFSYEPATSATAGSRTTPVMESPTSPGDTNIREGLGSLNRWSHSTVSSKNSIDHLGQGMGSHSREPSTTDRDNLKTAHPNANMEVSNSSSLVTNSAGDNEMHHRYTPDQSPTNVANPATSMLELGGIDMAPTFSASLLSATLADNDISSEPKIMPSLFQNPWSTTGGEPGISQQKPAGSTVERLQDNEFLIDDDSHLSTERRRRGHSQKTMLSKALQKANTAVLLDNAANFEGAMDAYSDACQLLQLVMLRSNGGKDEKLKLQEIVSLQQISTLQACGTKLFSATPT